MTNKNDFNFTSISATVVDGDVQFQVTKSVIDLHFPIFLIFRPLGFINGVPNCRGPLVLELIILSNERYATGW